MKTNKEIINELTEYFITQDIHVVAKTLAATMIDVKRMWEFQSLELEEQKSLLYRVQMNVETIKKFAQMGPDGKLTIENLESAP